LARRQASTAAAHRDILELSACNCNTHEIRLLREVASNLPAGRATIEFLFFGKAVRASGFDGPYVVRDLHGYWHENAQGPGVPIIEPLEFVTQRYRADEFSDQEWDSEEKRQRIALYEQTVALAASAH
jgi:hypothetical protein